LKFAEDDFVEPTCFWNPELALYWPGAGALNLCDSAKYPVLERSIFAKGPPKDDDPHFFIL
jgi:hypothetical protein